MNPRVAILIVAVMSIATVAVGLRVGAGDTVRAALVFGAPLPHGGGRAAWQVRTQEDDGRTRTAVSAKVVARVRVRNTERIIDLQTNLDGVAELPFEVDGLATGDHIELDVRDAMNQTLARGDALWPQKPVAPIVAEDISLRPSRSEGAVKMNVAVLGRALSPNQPGRVWIHQQTSTLTSNVEATPDLGIEVVSPYAPSHDVSCPHEGAIELVARGMSGNVALHAKDSEEHIGDWYGMVPVVPGAMHMTLPVTAPPGPVHVSITAAGASTLAYVEVDDDAGRSNAVTTTLTGEPPHADVTLDVRTPGRNFIVASTEPNGADSMNGATRAFPIWIGPNAPCEMSLAKASPQSFPRFVVLDGFVEKRAALSARRRKGRLIALVGLALGSLLETLLLLRAASDGKRALESVHNAIIEGGEALPATATRRRGPLDVLMVIVLSLLGFVLLFALIEWTSR